MEGIVVKLYEADEGGWYVVFAFDGVVAGHFNELENAEKFAEENGYVIDYD